MKRSTQTLLAVTTLFFCSTTTMADDISADSANTMTCGTNFISVGDPEATVLSTCGEPSFREGNRWTYSDTPGSFVYQLNLADGNVVSIDTLAKE